MWFVHYSRYEMIAAQEVQPANLRTRQKKHPRFWASERNHTAASNLTVGIPTAHGIWLLTFSICVRLSSPWQGVWIRYVIYMDERTACVCGFHCGNTQFKIWERGTSYSHKRTHLTVFKEHKRLDGCVFGIFSTKDTIWASERNPSTTPTFLNT